MTETDHFFNNVLERTKKFQQCTKVVIFTCPSPQKVIRIEQL